MGEIQDFGDGAPLRRRRVRTPAWMFVGCLLVHGTSQPGYPQSERIPQRPSRGNILRVRVVSTTNTQAVLAYSAPDSNPCTVQVSESNTLSPSVHDVDARLFAGANSDARSSSVNNGTARLFVVGARLSKTALDGVTYSRALQAYTMHYYRVACSGSSATGSFTTANIPLGMTYTDAPQIDPDTPNVPIVPTLTDTLAAIDPYTGAYIKIAARRSDTYGKAETGNSIAFLDYGGGTKMCIMSKVGPDNGYFCSFPTSGGGSAVLYYAVPATGEMRFLGFRAGAAGAKFILRNGQIVLYESNGHSLVRGVYTGNFVQAAPHAIASITFDPNPIIASIPDAMHALNSAYDTTAFSSCGLLMEPDSALGVIACLRSYQDSYGWLGAFDPATGTIVSALQMWTSPNFRWCSLHFTIPAYSRLVYFSAQNLKGEGVGLGKYKVSIPGAIDASTQSFLVSGEPTSAASDSHLYDAQVGDFFQFLDGTQETVRIASRNGASWTVQRGAWGPAARPHAAGAEMWAIGSGVKPCTSYPWWWNIDSGTLTADGVGSGHSDLGPDYRIREAYAILVDDLATNLSTPPDIKAAVSFQFAGAYGWADGNSLAYHPSRHQWDAAASEKSWLSDSAPFDGGPAYSAGSNPIVAGTAHVYKYRLATSWNNALGRKQVATLALSGPWILNDISGPGSVITDSTDLSYCVALVAGECRTGSIAGDIYVSASGVTFNGCFGSDGPTPGVHDLCVLNMPMLAGTVFQLGWTANRTGLTSGEIVQGLVGAGYARVLTHALNGPRFINIVAKPLPDASWMIFNTIAPQNYIYRDQALLKLPPTPTPDGVDRSTFIRAPVSIVTPPGQGIATAAVEFGYLEQGAPSQHYCTSRREACVAVSSTVTDATPFWYVSTDTYTRANCAASCTITLPVLPERVAYYQVKFYDAEGAFVGLGDPGVSVEAAAVKPGGASASALQ